MYEQLRETFKRNKKLGLYEMANYFVDKYHLKTIKEGRAEMYHYSDGIYIRAEQLIEKELRKLLDEEYTIARKREVLNQIHGQTYVDRKEFAVNKWLINLNNGVYNIKNKTFTKHSPDNLFFTKIPTNYDPDAVCIGINRFLNELLPEKDVTIIKEWFGYCLFRDYFIKKALIMTGEKNTGKTTLVNVFMRLIGLQNASGVSLQEMATNRFATSDLYNKYINLCDDMSSGDVKDSGRFKMVTGKSPISAEYKHGNRFGFVNFAKLTFACNRIPNVQDNDDDAYFERWMVVTFKRPPEKVDKFLLDKLTTETEMSGLLNSLLRHLYSIIERQNFSYHRTHEETKAEMLRSGSSVASFSYDCIKQSIGNWVSKANMHFYYSLYAKKFDLQQYEIKKFGKELQKYNKYCTEGRKNNVKGWNNVTVNDTFNEMFPNLMELNADSSEKNEDILKQLDEAI